MIVLFLSAVRGALVEVSGDLVNQAAPVMFREFRGAASTACDFKIVTSIAMPRPDTKASIVCAERVFLEVERGVAPTGAFFVGEFGGSDALKLRLRLKGKHVVVSESDAEFIVTGKVAANETNAMAVPLFVMSEAPVSFLKCGARVQALNFQVVACVLFCAFCAVVALRAAVNGRELMGGVKIVEAGHDKCDLSYDKQNHVSIYNMDIVRSVGNGLALEIPVVVLSGDRAVSEKVKVNGMCSDFTTAVRRVSIPVNIDENNTVEVVAEKKANSTDRFAMYGDLFRLLLQGAEMGLATEYKPGLMDQYAMWIRDLFDLSVMQIACRTEDGVTTFVKVGDVSTQDILDKFASGEIKSGAFRFRQSGYRFTVKTVKCGNRELIGIIGIEEDKANIEGYEDCFRWFIVYLMGFWYTIVLQDAKERSSASYISLIQSSHAFAITEFDHTMTNVISEIGTLGSDPLEQKTLRARMMDFLSVEDRIRYTQAAKKLSSHGESFSQASYKIPLPSGNVKCLSLSGQATYDETYEANILTILCEDISDFRQVEDLIQETVHELALASHLLRLHKYVQTSDGRIVSDGDTLFKDLGYVGPVNTSEMTLSEIVYPDDMEKFLSLEEAKTATIRIKDATASYQWFTAVCTSTKGNKRGFMFNVQELTQLQSTVKSTRELFQIGSTTGSFAFWALNLDSKEPPHAVFETKQFSHLIRLCHPSSVKQINIAELRSLQAPKMIELQLRLNKTIPYQWFAVTFIPVNSRQLLCCAFNIDERKKTHDLLRQTQQLLDMAFTYSDVRMWSFEDTRKNSRTVLTLDTEYVEEVVMDWSVLDHNLVPEYQESVIKAFKDALAGASKLEVEVPFFFDNLHWLLLRGIPVDDGGQRRLIGIYVELTAIKEAAQDLEREKAAAEEAAMAKSTFLANMSHEIRTPLNGICGLLEIIQGSELTKEQRELTNTIQSSFLDLLELLNDILDLAKLESHKLQSLSVKFDPCESIDTARDTTITRKNSGAVRIHLITEPDQPIYYQGDPHCFLRIVTNLLSNAVKFTPSGYINIVISSEDSQLVVSVIDSGKGMEQSLVQGIQDHFDHGETITVYEDKCVGVGLSLVTEMVKFLKGRIQVSSTIGSGSCFKCTLPFKPVYFPIKTLVNCSSKKKVLGLLIDDMNKQMIQHYAEFYGMRFEQASDIKAVERDGASFDVVIVESDGKSAPISNEAIEKGVFEHVIVAILSPSQPEGLKDRFEHFRSPLRPHLLRDFFVKIAFGKITPKTYFKRYPSTDNSSLALHILAADDNVTNQLVIKQMLKKLGCTFVVVANGEEAIAAVQKERFDVVLMDQFMPVLDGREATKRIRALASDAADVPIIAMTASMMQDEEECRAAGMNAFICKPVTLKNLTRVIRSVVYGS